MLYFSLSQSLLRLLGWYAMQVVGILFGPCRSASFRCHESSPFPSSSHSFYQNLLLPVQLQGTLCTPIHHSNNAFWNMIKLAKVMAWVGYNENVESAHGRKKLDFVFEVKKWKQNIQRPPFQCITRPVAKVCNKKLVYIEKGRAPTTYPNIFHF